MRIVTTTCTECGTVIAGNVLEQHRTLKCPQIHCDAVLRFDDLSEKDQQGILQNKEYYQL